MINNPRPYISTGNQIRVIFHTDYSSSGMGFNFLWEAIPDNGGITVVPSATMNGTCK